MAGARRARKSPTRLRPALGADSAFLVRPSSGDLYRSDAAAYGVRVRQEMQSMMRGAVSQGAGDVLPDAAFSWAPITGAAAPVSTSYTRSGTSWAFVNGVLTSFNTNVPRLTGTNGGYLSEITDRNEMPVSGDLSNAAWTKENVTLTDNGTNAIGLREFQVDAGTGVSARRRIFDTSSVGSAGVGGVIAKAGTGRYMIVSRGGDLVTDYAVFDLVGGVITESGGGIVSAHMFPRPGGFYRCYILTADTSSQLHCIVCCDTATPGTGNYSYAAANETYLLCNSMYTSKQYFTAPILSTAGGITRNRDVMTGTNWIAAAPYTVYADLTFPEVVGPSSSDDCPIFQFGATAADRLTAYIVGANVRLHLTTAGGISITKDIARASVEGDRLKIAARLATNNAALAIEGQVIAADTSTGTIPTGSLGLGYGNTTMNSRAVHHEFRVYADDVPNDDLDVLVGN